MSPTDSPIAFEPLTDAETDELEQFLMSDARSDETMTLDCLDGFLTALVIGPVTIMPSRWLSRVWGPNEDDAPEYESMEQAQRILELLMRHMNGIVYAFEEDPAAYEPLFAAREIDGREHVEAEGWAIGFMDGIELAKAEWRPLLDDETMIDALWPIHLLGSEHVTATKDALTQTPEQREQLAQKIPAALTAIHAFWLPYRRAMHERNVATTVRRASPKVGRNDPCPCGSGLKFKKCCGKAEVLH